MRELLPRQLDCDGAIDLILSRAGASRALSVAAPLGLGKPNHLLNRLYRRVREDARTSLHLYTALSLDLPEPASDLERRFLGPFLDRHFGADYPRLAYVADMKADRLPPNVHVEEFYFQSGAMLGSTRAQRDYASINYTSVARELAERAGLHAIVQLVAVRGDGAQARYSLSCNPDVTLDVLEAIEARGGERPLVIGVVHPELPFLGGGAEVDATFFDGLVDGGTPHQPLFALPKGAVDPAEHAIGLHASTLVRDGGTLQIGIGALGDAIVHALLLRHRDTAAYLDTLRALRATDPVDDPLVARWGGLAPFTAGLYGASEMLMDGFMHLRKAGILTRTVHDDVEVEQALARGEPVDPARLRGGHYLKAAFYLGTHAFYAWLRALEGDDHAGLAMSAVSDVNQLYGGRETLDALQRRDARFFNTCMIASLLGAATSDALEDGRVVSGVGGQYNFVAMAHAIPGGRSVLLLRATRSERGRVVSNIRWNYGHATIPRHLRDIYVTEYGVADLRGRSDETCIRAMLAISDARFIDALADEARRAGKLARDFAIPAAWRDNTPAGLARRLSRAAQAGRIPTFPFGTDFDAIEQRVLPALMWLKARQADPRRWPALLGALLAPGTHADQVRVLARLDLAAPRGLKDRLIARLVRGAVARSG